ncbi:putative inorganic phosphate cotransporter [Drosophila rhopaloa]|uniref:Putative inorganic phosphate cotransporter n=1 Tax=Drosophila rhopaloa TaxID=1041015 RepID=A0A6P4FLS1_DRORH|nr:putative inorganic phosphate cotransporter [Drosophila rhopaloa]
MTTALTMVKPGGKYANEKFFGVRHVQCILCFFCLAMSYAWRVNLSVAVVAMSDNSNNTAQNNTDHSEEADGSEFDFFNSERYYSFTKDQRAYMLGSFFYGYVVTQVPGGYFAQIYGAKTMLMYGLGIAALITILSPLSLQLGGWFALCCMRFAMGLSQGAVHPATHALLAKWSPAQERGLLGTLCYSGAQFGTVVMLATSGYIADSFMGWPSIFYLGGACGFLWMIFWYVFSASTPEEHRLISPEELKYITESRSDGKMQSAEKLAPTPWKSIFTSLPFLSLLVVHCTHMFGFWLLLTQIPTYMKAIYGKDIKESALSSALPYMVMLLMSFFFVWLSKVLQKKEGLSLSFNRKIFNTIGHWVPMVSLIALGYVPQDNSALAITLLTVTVGISAATYLGFQVNHIDLSPNYAGTLMGLTNGAANVMSGIAPIIVGWIVHDEKNVHEWRLVFLLAAAFYFVGNLLFVIFGRTEVQWWDSPRDNKEDAEQGTPLAPNGQVK